jgi:hypothetical protein
VQSAGMLPTQASLVQPSPNNSGPQSICSPLARRPFSALTSRRNGTWFVSISLCRRAAAPFTSLFFRRTHRLSANSNRPPQARNAAQTQRACEHAPRWAASACVNATSSLGQGKTMSRSAAGRTECEVWRSQRFATSVREIAQMGVYGRPQRPAPRRTTTALPAEKRSKGIGEEGGMLHETASRGNTNWPSVMGSHYQGQFDHREWGDRSERTESRDCITQWRGA